MLNFNVLKENNAFTLAEVLITLGIIGLVAAMTIPSLIANTQKDEAVSKLKAYSTISQAILLAKADNGSVSDWSWRNPDGVK